MRPRAEKPKSHEMKPWEYDVPNFDNIQETGVFVKRVKLTMLKKTFGWHRWFKLIWWDALLTPPRRD